MEMAITDKDRVVAGKFCNDIGCTAIHVLRDKLPGLLAEVREAERARCVAVIEEDNGVEEEPPAPALLMIADKAATGVHAIVELMRGAVRINRGALVRRIQE